MVPAERAQAVAWDERQVARVLAVEFFEKKHLLLVPNCHWTGNETDLLVVTRDLRIIDIEIKISRADFRADRKKQKWFHYWDKKIDGPYGWQPPRPRQWPEKAWKHYYCMPVEIWAEHFRIYAGSPTSGLLTFDRDHRGRLRITCQRRATPCRDAQKISAEDAIDIARLASLRMWDVLAKRERKYIPEETII